MEQQSMIEKTWYTLSGDKVEDIRDAVRKACEGSDKVVIIGTDSQMHRRLEFVTTIVVYTIGKGGRVFYTKTFQEHVSSLRKKLVDEAWLSIYTAWQIEPYLPPDVDLGAIHADVNPDPTADSSKYHDEIYWLIKGQGFEVVTKPLAYASSHIAEHIVKHRNVGRY